MLTSSSCKYPEVYWLQEYKKITIVHNLGQLTLMSFIASYRYFEKKVRYCLHSNTAA